MPRLKTQNLSPQLYAIMWYMCLRALMHNGQQAGHAGTAQTHLCVFVLAARETMPLGQKEPEFLEPKAGAMRLIMIY